MISFLLVTAYFSLGIITYIYIGYPLILTLFSYLIPKPRVKRDEIRPTVSLIISCYNEENVLPEKLANSLTIDYPKERLEIIVVSDGSTDRTDEIALEHRDQGVKLIRIEGRLGKTMGLNEAVAQASGEIIVFSDANAMYQPDAITKMVENFADESVGYVVGRAKYINVDTTASAKSEDAYWHYEIFLKKLESKLHSIVGGDGAIYAIRKELYETLQATDINDFVNPLQIISKGFRGIYEPGAICLEETSGSFRKEINRKIRIVNRSFIGLLRNKSVMNPFITGIFSLEIISHKLLRWLTPLFIISLSISSIILSIIPWRHEHMFQCSSAIIVLFFVCSYIGYIFSSDPKLPSLFYYPFYFTAVNIAALIGTIKSLKGTVFVTWDTPRTNNKSIITVNNFTSLLIHCLFVVNICYLAFLIEEITHADDAGIKILFWLSIVIIFYVYFGYPIVLYFLSALAKKPTTIGDVTPTVSLLICAYNEESIIADKIENSLQLEYPADKLKIVVASDGSDDQTNEIVEKYTDNRIKLFAYKTRNGKVSVINKTVPKLESEIIVFSDANTMYKTDAIRKLVRHFYDPTVGAVSADVILSHDKTSIGKSESIYYLYERWIQAKESAVGSIIGADGGMYAIRRHLFTAPSDNIILDDFIISMNVTKKGYRLLYDEEAIGHEKTSTSPVEEFLRKSRVIAGAIQAMRHYEGIPSVGSKMLFFCFISHKLLRWLIPLFMILIFCTNGLLVAMTPSGWYQLAFVLQILFYIIAALGMIMSTCTSNRFLSVPFYFCLMNGAALCGIYKGLLNKQSVKWRMFARAEKY